MKNRAGLIILPGTLPNPGAGKILADRVAELLMANGISILPIAVYISTGSAEYQTLEVEQSTTGKLTDIIIIDVKYKVKDDCRN